MTPIEAAAIEANYLMQLYAADWKHVPDNVARAINGAGTVQEIWRAMLEHAADQIEERRTQDSDD